MMGEARGDSEEGGSRWRLGGKLEAASYEAGSWYLFAVNQLPCFDLGGLFSSRLALRAHPPNNRPMIDPPAAAALNAAANSGAVA